MSGVGPRLTRATAPSRFPWADIRDFLLCIVVSFLVFLALGLVYLWQTG